MEYPVHRPIIKHYGYNVHVPIKKAPRYGRSVRVKRNSPAVIGAYMKLAYNQSGIKEHFVSDDNDPPDGYAYDEGSPSIDEEKDLLMYFMSQINQKDFYPTVNQITPGKSAKKPRRQK